MIRHASRAKWRAYAAWAQAAGPFWQYTAATPFYVQVPRECAPIPLEEGRWIVEHSIAPFFASVAGRTALLLDLPMHLSLATTPAFHEAGWLVVPVVARWPGSRPLLSVGNVLAHLVWLSTRLYPPGDPRGVVFALDADRQGMPNYAVAERQFDNRYWYKADDVPSAKLLREWGVEVVGVAAHYHSLPGDVKHITEGFSRSGMAVSRIWIPPRDAQGAD